MKETTITLTPISVATASEIPYIETRIAAGFPSPCQDYQEGSIDLNRELIRNAAATFCAKVSGNSMIDEGIEDGDILVIDKSVKPCDGKIVVSYIDGEFTLKKLRIMGNKVWLQPANPAFAPIPIREENHFLIWGVVMYVIKKK